MPPFFALLDWSVVPERSTDRPWPGPPPQPRRAVLQCLLVQICEDLDHSTDLRRFLVRHPALVLTLGLRPVLAPTQRWGFDVARTVPSARHFRRVLRTLDNAILQQVLSATVARLRQVVPAFGDVVAIDVKHLYAWVKENNPRESVPDRYNPQRQPRGDPDCALGTKPTHNRGRPVPAQPAAAAQDVAAAAPPGARAQKEWLWGYGTGVCVARDAVYGEVVLAEATRPFNVHDSQYGLPLLGQAQARLGHGPQQCSADAAYDAWYIYEYVAAGGGTAFIPLNTHGAPLPTFGPHGQHLCADGREMVPGARYYDRERGHHVEDEHCPLRRQPVAGATCGIAHPQWQKGRGCIKHRNTEAGATLRLAQDRQSAAFRTAYKDRTAAERINSQAQAWGIERPHLRRIAAIRNRNTLIYCVINLTALQRIRTMQHNQHPP